MLPIGSIFDDAATGAGFMAASIAVCGFVAHAQPVLTERDDRAVRSATVRGGLWGLALAVLVSIAAVIT